MSAEGKKLRKLGLPDISFADAIKILELPSGASDQQIHLHYNLLVNNCRQSGTKEESNERKNILDAAYLLMLQLRNEMDHYISDSYPSSGDSDDSDCDSDVANHLKSLTHLAEYKIRQDLQEKRFVGKQIEKANLDAECSAADLITEEEKEKRKAEKRKQKRKKKKEKKLLAKQQQEATTKKEDKNQKMSDNEDEDRSSDSESEEEEGLDPNSAFVSGAASKSMANKAIVKDSKIMKADKSQIMPLQEKAFRYAQRGNIKANEDRYEDAIHNYTEAIRLQPNDYRFYGNRSYCYERISNFNKALEDAEKAISLEPKWAKNYFRKGLALASLNRHQEAEEAFKEVLRLDKDCNEAKEELFALRISQIKNMGFNQQAAYAAAIKYDSVEDAIDGLLNGIVSEDSLAEIYMSDEDEEDVYTQGSVAETNLETDSSNPRGFLSLWVGNVSESVTEADLKKLFSKFGEVASLFALKDKLIGDKYCAFVNFKDKLSPGKAMENLQGHLLFGHRLKIKFPNSHLSINNNAISKTSVAGVKSGSNSIKPAPINGECYFWRKQGFCTRGDMCKYKHVKEHKAIDAKK